MIFDLSDNPYVIFCLILLLLVIRYTLIAGSAFIYFWIWKKDKFQKFRIQEKFPAKDKLIYEIKYSFLTLLIFAINGIGVYYGNKSGLFHIYTNIDESGRLYYYASFLLILLFHDTYFYWMHRAIHWKPLYKYIHKVHHNSTNPSPLAAFSFHPWESMFEALIIPLYLLVLPLHFHAIVFFLITMTVLNVLGHLGYEFYPSGFTNHWFFKWINTSTHHNMHHKFFENNYGLYLNFWDRLMGTNHPQYTEIFENIKRRALSS